MKCAITFILIVILGSAQYQLNAQAQLTSYKKEKNYQNSYNQTPLNQASSTLQLSVDVPQPLKRSELCNSGITTIDNLDSYNRFYNIGIGTSYKISYLSSPDSIANRMRFIRLNFGGTALDNLGYEFTDAGNKSFHSSGNSIAEVKNDLKNGGYVAVGSVASNDITGAVASGTSDILFARLDARGAVLSASRIDINSGKDTAWCIRKSATLHLGMPTWILVGQSAKDTRTDCVVARVTALGSIVWCRRYNFDPGGSPFNSAHCIAKQLCEDAAGNIYVVGTLQDNPASASDIDGLAFKLNSAGSVLWAYKYHSSTDDRFQAVRLTGDRKLIVGGFTNHGGSYNMLIAKLDTSGQLLFRNKLRAYNGGTISPSKAYDIIEVSTAQGVKYYLSGVLTTSFGNYEMLYLADAFGKGVIWNSYQKMMYNKQGFGLDYNPDVNVYPYQCRGIIYFSSMLNSSALMDFSDSHIMKTELSTVTCNFSNTKAPNTLLVIPMTRTTLPRSITSTGTRSSLKWVPFNYQSTAICKNYIEFYENCTAALAPAPAPGSASSSPVMEQQVTEAGKLHITPNPVAGTLRIRFRSLPAGEYQVSVTDMEGKLVLQGKKVYNNGSSLAALDVSSLKPGVYLLRAGNGTLLLHQKVVKQ